MLFCICPLVLRLTQYSGPNPPVDPLLGQQRQWRRFRASEAWLRSGINSQVHAVRRLATIYSDVGVCPVEHLQPESAFQSLLGVKTGYSSEPGAASLGATALYRKGAVKLPRQSPAICDITELLPEELGVKLRSCTGLLRPPDVAQEHLDI